jgi:hypothetical protein
VLIPKLPVTHIKFEHYQVLSYLVAISKLHLRFVISSLSSALHIRYEYELHFSSNDARVWGVAVEHGVRGEDVTVCEMVQ